MLGHLTVPAISSLLGFVMALGTGVYAWRNRQKNGALQCSVLAWVGALWSLRSVAEWAVAASLVAPDLVSLVDGETLQGVLLLVWPLFLLALARHYPERPTRRQPMLWIGLSLLVCALAAVTIIQHNPALTQSVTELLPDQRFSTFMHAPLLMARIRFAWSGALVAIGVVMLLKTFCFPRQYARRQIGVALLGVLTVAGGVIMALVDLALPIDPEPLAFGLGSVLMAWGIVPAWPEKLVLQARNTLTDTLPASVFVVNDRDRLIDLNAEAKALLASIAPPEKNSADRLGRPLEEVLAAWPDFVQWYRKNPEGSTEIRLASDAEHPRTLSIASAALRTPKGTLRGRLVTLYDITERLRTEHALRHTEAELQETRATLQATDIRLQATSQSLQETETRLHETQDTVQHIEASLRQTEETLTETEAARRQLEETLHVSDAQLRQTQDTLTETKAARCQLEVALQASAAKLRQTEDALRASEEKVRQTAEALNASEENARQTIEALNASERERERQQEALRCACENAQAAQAAAQTAQQARDRFLNTMRTEFYVPLNAIIGFSKFMTRDPRISPAQREHLAMIHASGERLLDLVHDTLDMVAIESGGATIQTQHCDLYQLLRDLESGVSGWTSTTEVKYLVEQSAELPQYIRIDEDKLRHILRHSLNTAVKSLKHGSVTLNAGLAPHDQIASEAVSDEKEEREPSRLMLQFEIRPSGEPRLPEDLAQEENDLGYLLSRRFVDLLDGQVLLECRDGAQETMRLMIPAEPDKARPSKAALPERRQIVRLAPEEPVCRILVAHRDLYSRRLLRELLQTVGFSVQEALCGKSAVDIVEVWRPHLICLDLHMTGMDGDTVVRTIRAEHRQETPAVIPKVFALTAGATPEGQEWAFAAGCDDVLATPFRESEIFGKIAASLDVKYVYDTRASQSAQAGAVKMKRLANAKIPEHLATLPVEVLHALEVAAAQFNPFKLSMAVETIWLHNAALADAVEALAYQNSYKTLLTLVQQTKDASGNKALAE